MEYNDNVMTLAEVASYLKLSEKTVLKMVRNHEIPCAKVANQWRFLKTMLDDWLIAKMKVIPQNDLSRLIEMESEYIPLSRLFDEQLIMFDIAQKSKRDVLQELVLLAKANNLIADEGPVLEKLIEREQLMSTAVGHGIALPHLRKPDSKLVYGPKIIIGISREGIEFGSLDKKPTHLVFLILTDSETVHIRVMAKLAGILNQPGVVETILQFSSSDEVLLYFITLESATMLP
ncbi:MAG: PTS sugar transporter subunit IIA [Spirochaetales bacterium]|nr:PTS sugar transporter subunit IIA [Spirochaetales bacterium]